MATILHVRAREILDSRGFPTLEAEIELDNGMTTRASVPSGASVGSHEACERRDGGARYGGMGVRDAVAAVEGEIADVIRGLDPQRLSEIDALLRRLDGTDKLSRLGANAILGVSLAVCRAAAAASDLPLYRWCGGGFADLSPVPLINVINGGAHADNDLVFQEFMIVPFNAPCFAEALRMGAEIFHALKARLNAQGLSSAVGDEGGFAPSIAAPETACDLLMRAVEDAGRRPGRDVGIALDMACGALQDENGRYRLSPPDRRAAPETADGVIRLCERLLDAYPIVSIEDPLGEDDWDGWRDLTSALAHRCQLVGDDLFVTDRTRLQRGIDLGVANAILIKPNQTGTVSDAFAVAATAQRAAYAAVMSHRSGETEDCCIADFAVATQCAQIKTGSLSRSERLAKYNRLLRIEEELGGAARYAGRDAFAHLRAGAESPGSADPSEPS